MDNTATQTTENLKRVTLRSLFLNGKFKGISKLRFNENGYPFVSLVRDDKSATNLYFTKKASERIALNSFQKGEDLMQNGFLLESEVVQTESKQEGHEGETRFKLSIPSLESNYSSGASMEAAWGNQNTSEFDEELFLKEFTKKTVVSIPSEA